jgi:hypothetical protein
MRDLAMPLIAESPHSQIRYPDTTDLRYRRLLVVWRQLVVEISDERDTDLGGVVSAQDVTDEVRVDLHLDLRESAGWNYGLG